MLNPDGYTPLFNPTEYPPTKPAAFGYIPGKWATGGDLSATLNPFVAYRRDTPRRMFEAGGSETQTIKLHVPPEPFHFGYAVDACWQLVPHEIVDPLVDFPPDANCLEAYEISIDVPYGLGPDPGSEVQANVIVSDHQGIDTVFSVTLEAPDLFQGEVALNMSAVVGEESWLFNGAISNLSGVPPGKYPLLVRVVDTGTDQNLGPVDAWFLSGVQVERGWARTWGGTGGDNTWSVAIDASGNDYVTGFFEGTVDFNPGGEVDNHTSNGYSDAFLSKFDSSGNFLWARTWGGGDHTNARSVAIDASGNAYVTGSFYGIVDFDPGNGVDNHESSGLDGAFLSKFDPGGDFLWARTWGGSYYVHAWSVAIDPSNDVYVTGYFEGTADFDPGSGVDSHAPNGAADAFLSKFDPNGDFLWARTWGAAVVDAGYSVAVDASDNAYVTGWFYGTVDFDPGGGVDDHASNGGFDAYLSSFDSSGDFIWARTWGGVDEDQAWSVAIDTSGNACVTGKFRDTVDFDPGSGVDDYTSNGSWDVYLTKFDSGGDFIWARTWGGADEERAWSVAMDAFGNAHVAGSFRGTLDFDSGSGLDNHTSIGQEDAYLSKLDSNGNFVWARTWGGADFDDARSVAIDASGNAYVTGDFYDTVDFDPGSGVDNHTSSGGFDVFLSRFPPDGNW
jgi:hypothetical protein